MDLLDRYLQSVKKHLPWNRQDDIVAELRANLESQLDERESELGRPLTQPEAEAWLKEIGPPMQVAARYMPQQSLIGPSIFPTYWFVMRMAMIWGFVALVILSAIRLMMTALSADSASMEQRWQGVFEALLNIPFTLFQIAAWVTLFFAAFEFARTSGWIDWPSTYPGSADWSPSKLPPVERNAVPGAKPRSKANAIAEVVIGVPILFFLLLVSRHPLVLLGPGAYVFDQSRFELAPVIGQFFWCVIALNAFQLAWNAIDLARDLGSGQWQDRRPGKRLIFKVCGIIPLVVLIMAPDHILLVLLNPAANAAKYGQIVHAINYWSHFGLSLALAITTIQLAWSAIQWGQNLNRRRVAVN